MSLIVGGHIRVFVEKIAKNGDFMRLIERFWKKNKRGEAMKWYFLHSPGQEEQFKLYFTPPQGF